MHSSSRPQTNRRGALTLLAAASVLLFTGSSALRAADAKDKGIGPREVVKHLYAAHDAKKGPFFESDKRPLLDQYFTKDLADLIWKDRVKSKGEVGALDFDPLYAAQDFKISKFVIKDAVMVTGGKADVPEEAAVEVNFKSLGEARVLTFKLRKSKDGSWKINDIRYPEKETLRSILGGK